MCRGGEQLAALAAVPCVECGVASKAVLALLCPLVFSARAATNAFRSSARVKSLVSWLFPLQPFWSWFFGCPAEAFPEQSRRKGLRLVSPLCAPDFSVHLGTLVWQGGFLFF